MQSGLVFNLPNQRVLAYYVVSRVFIGLTLILMEFLKKKSSFEFLIHSFNPSTGAPNPPYPHPSRSSLERIGLKIIYFRWYRIPIATGVGSIVGGGAQLHRIMRFHSKLLTLESINIWIVTGKQPEPISEY